MPKYWNPCSFLPRRLQIVASLTGFVLFCIIFLGTSTSDQYDPYLKDVPYSDEIKSGTHQAIDAAHQAVDNLPKLPKNVPASLAHLNPFKAPAHTPPPEQANSTSGETRWYSSWKWQNPFSSSVTFDEDRSVLPPEANRPPIYTYFDISGRKNDEKSQDAQKELLEIWRRAWWAKGFKPVVLGQPEAQNNPQYRTIAGLELDGEMEYELKRWLAWGNMGTGILCDWLAVPMGEYDDPLLAFMRRGEYPKLTRYGDLSNALFIGSKDQIEATIKAALANPDLLKKKSIQEAVPAKTFTVDKNHDGIAFYSPATIKARYSKVQAKLADDATQAEGLNMLAQVVNAHLQTTWQASYPLGVAVLKPLPQHTSMLIAPAIDLARNLSQCPFTPEVSSCPPNKRTCAPCVATSPARISTPPVFRNKTEIFTIATVPHPFTLLALTHSTPTIDLQFLRRNTHRDAWILAATKELLGTGISSFARLAALKNAVASDFSRPHTLWLTAEDYPENVLSEEQVTDLDWTFGFKIPRSPPSNGHSVTPVPGPERRPPPPKQEFEGPEPSEKELVQETTLLAGTRMALNGQESDAKSDGWLRKLSSKKEPGPDFQRVKEAVEAWNLADTEAWKFVRAFGARKAMEKAKWEEEEERYLEKGMVGRWVDKVI
jgi:hypothetical protein